MLYFNIAVKSILTRRRQYKSLFAVCAVGVCLMLCAVMITDGMINSMNEKSRVYYGGDLQLLGGHLDYRFPYSQAQKDVQMLKNILGDDVSVSARYCYDISATEGWYFNGTSACQRVIMGVDFNLEADIFKTMTFVEGSANPDGNEATVIISKTIADKLGCKAGDTVTLLVYTEEGYPNTMDFVLTGIFMDTSVFGMYTSYVDYKSLMSARNIPVQDYTADRISINYANRAPSFAEKQYLQASLEKIVKMHPLGMAKEQVYEAYRSKGDDSYALIGLEANVSNLSLLVTALKLVITAIIVLLVLIISVGISSTFRVIIIKRTIENGTFRALGMKAGGIMKLFLTEVLVLLVTGCLVGFTAALVISKIAGCFDLSFISGFDLFLTGGHLAPAVSFLKILGLIVLIFVTIIVSVLFTLRKLVHVSPVGALAATV